VEAVRALGRWPALADTVRLLTDRWPGQARGVHRVELPELDAILDVAVLDAAEALEGWSGRADAWLLDGFAPALNPQMWTDEILALVAARSAPGARAATFTVAGQVRRGLAAAGFAVEKRPGFGRKRERLEARRPGHAVDPPHRTVAIVGGGIAGASAARAVRALGGEAVVVEASAPGAGGSGNPAALVTPRLDAALGPAAQLFARAFDRACQLYAAAPGAVLTRGVLQLAFEDRDPARFGRVAGSDLFEPGALALIEAPTVSARLGEAAPGGLDQTTALAIDPAPILEAWAGDAITAEVAALEPCDDGWRLLDRAGAEIVRAGTVIVAAALGSRDLLADLPLTPVRGQASWTTTREADAPAAAWGGYVLRTRTGLLFGATHDRGEVATDLRPEDHRRNLESLALALPRLAERLDGAPLEGRASIRAVTPDHLPLAGAAGPEGLFVLAGLGSRGFSFAPLLAEHVAALALGAPSPLPRAAAELVAPERFARRAARRRGS
jgi:tRNA 5-methylaminomethyl-2-thiouridine biosynthesis bifunctional protein